MLTKTSVITTVCLTSLLAFVLCLCAKNNKIIKHIGPNVMILLFLAVIIRLFVPFEFSYTRTVAVEDILSSYYTVLSYQVFQKVPNSTVWNCLIFVWLAGAGIGVLYKIFHYKKIIHYTVLCQEENWDEVFCKYCLDKKRYKGIEQVKLIYNDYVKSPCAIGVKHPCIILPNIIYQRNQLHYIILHELVHIQNKDIVWKIGIDLLCTFFWWNPVIWYLKKEMFQLIEMRNDMKVTAILSEQETVEYMECLKDSAIQLSKREIGVGTPFKGNSYKILKRRIKLIAEKESFCYWKCIGALVFGLALLFLTSIIIIEPYSFKEVEEWPSVTNENSYLIKNNEKYDVYLYGKYMMTVDSLLGFKGINIYESLEEARKER